MHFSEKSVAYLEKQYLSSQMRNTKLSLKIYNISSQTAELVWISEERKTCNMYKDSTLAETKIQRFSTLLLGFKFLIFSSLRFFLKHGKIFG